MRLAAAALALVLVYSQPSTAQVVTKDSISTPSEIVKLLNTGLLSIMKGGEELGFLGRLDTITPVVEQTFDIQYLSASTIGKTIWKSWTKDQKLTYVSMFERFLTANYASQFKSFSGQNFEILNTKTGPKSTILVETQISRPNKEPVALTYLTRVRQGKTGIIDIFLAGTISEAARRRSEFSTIYQEHGFSGLIDMLENQIIALTKGSADTAAKIFPEVNSTMSPRAEL